jgi:hypothetical protein
MPQVSKLGALKVLDHDLWVSTMKQAFEEGRTNAEANAWLEKRGYGPVSDRAMRAAVDEMRKELGHSIRTERPLAVTVGPKRPCKACKGFGRIDPTGKPSLKRGHKACEACGGEGKLPGEVVRERSLASIAGSLGGAARAAKLSPEERSEVARSGAQARWANTGDDQ